MSFKIIIALNTSWNLINFRSGLIKALVAQGYEVIAVAPVDEYTSKIEKLGCRFISIPLDSSGMHIGRDLILFARYFKFIRIERPNIFLGFTIKPNIYGSIVAHIFRVPVINNVAGLGAAFMNDGWLNQLVRTLYRVSFSRSKKVFFQNCDDRKLFVSNALVSNSIADLLPGSGVDLDMFKPVVLPANTVFRFLLIARMLWNKGVGEYVEAARLLQQCGIKVECCLLGFLDVENPAAISRKQMDEWVAEGVVRYLGVSDDVRVEIAQADCVVLPSFYREGTPRSLLEAAAMARPIVTTDSVGCRDVVDDGVNGYLCIPKNSFDLAEKMKRIVSMSPAERNFMGLRGRIKIEREFDEQIVIKKYLSAIELVNSKKSLNKILD